MSDGIKTLIYAGTALVCALVAYAWRPADVPPAVSGAATTVLFPTFDDAQKAKSLEISSYDELKSESLKPFIVEQQKNGNWTIPSHDNYPADADNQLRDVATLLFDLRSLGVASEVSEDHEMFGVKSPDKDQLKKGDRGVGLQVRLKDEKGETLASLIIGNKVKGADDQRFVRIPNQDPVYVVKIDPAKLSIKFADWIEKDLLNLNAFDVSRIRLRDYSMNRSEGGFVQDPRLDADVAIDATSSQWTLNSLQTFLRGKPVATQLAENEELNKEKLDAMKTALDDLQIVDVHPKPKGLKADLKADAGFLNDTEGVQSLITRGFFPLRSRNSTDAEIYSANGEVHVSMKDGIEYVLRFGNIAGAEEGSAEAKLNRFLFVLARIDESQFTPPELEAEPTDEPAATTEKPAAPTEKPAAPAEKPAAKPCDDDADASQAADDKPDAKSDAKTDENPAEKPAEKPAAKPGETPAAKPAAKKPDLAAERERIKKENQRKLDDLKERRTRAENRVKELNARFADWYYVIPEDTYKKIHLGRVDLIREKSAASDEGIGIDSFRKLQKEGVDPPPAPPVGGPPRGMPPGGRGLPPGLGFPPGE